MEKRRRRRSPRPAAAPQLPPAACSVLSAAFTMTSSWSEKHDGEFKKSMLIVTPSRKRWSLELCSWLLSSAQQRLDVQQEAMSL